MFFLFILAALAAETGGLRGTVVDDAGMPIPGAIVHITGSGIAGEITVETDENGRFRMDGIPPGTHEIVVEKAGFSELHSTVTVRIDETLTVPVSMVPAEAGMEMIVEAQLPVIDSTKSTVSTSMDSDLLQNLPVGRSYQDAVNMLPGVYGRVDTETGGPGSGNPSVRGEGQYGNNYLLDGISTRDPATKTFGADVNFDAIEEIQVYTDGLPAEFGQSTGMLVNVVTKDGGDEHFGSVGYWGGFDADPGTTMILNPETGLEEESDKRDFFNNEVSLTAGGPIQEERLWYFVALGGSSSSTTYEGMDPDAPNTDFGGQGFGKVTYFATPDLNFQVQVGYGGVGTDYYDASGLYAPEANGRYDSRDLTTVFSTRWRPTETSNLELKYSVMKGTIDVVPMSGNEDEPQIFDADTGIYTNNWDSFDTNERSRFGLSLKYTWLVDGLLGDHKFKVGAEAWQLSESRGLVYTGPGDGVKYWRSEAEGYPCTAESGYSDCLGYTEYIPSGGALQHKGNVQGVFVQDDWQPVPNVTLNIGARMDREALYTADGVNVYSAAMPAPRTGLAWDITGDSKNVLTANYGRYYDVQGNDFAAWGDSRSAYGYREYQYDPVAGDYVLVWVQDPVSDPLVYCNDESRKDSVIDQACGKKNLVPYHNDKLVLGFSHELVPLLSVSVRGILSATTDLAEDVDVDASTWVITNPSVKRRDYRGVELAVIRAYDERWQALASYTLGASTGTSPGQFELASGGQSGSDGNNVGVFLDDVGNPDARDLYWDNGYEWLVGGLSGLGYGPDENGEYNDAGYYGYLPYHSFHQVKLSGSYTLPVGTTFAAVYEYDSGHAWQRRGYVDLYGDYYAFPEGRGSRFMPPVHYIDLRVAHTFPLPSEQEVEITADVFNVPGFETPITYYENDNESFGKVMFRQAPRSVRLGVRYTY